MPRAFLVLSTLVMLSFAPALCADAFDYYTNPILKKAAEADGAKEIKQLTPALMAEHDHVLPKSDTAFVVVQTNDNHFSKLLLRSGFRKVDAERKVPILIIERFVTYKEGEERQVLADGKNIDLFAGFRFNLDIGQVVPEELGGDLRLVFTEGKTFVEPLGKAKLYLLTKPIAEATPKKPPKIEIGETFKPAYFNGTYKLFDDGRRSGTLKLQVAEDGDVTGDYYTDKDGQKYEVKGKIGTPVHSIQFTIKFPRTAEVFDGFLFTGDGKAITGTSRMEERPAGFYAVRVED
ncbi:MAG TPA: hypothetical protein VGG61_10565 [Gemmataceae bacterium]